NDITAEDFDPMSFAVDGVVAGMDLKFAGLKPSQFNFSDISGRYKNMADGIDWSPTNPMDSNRFGDAVQAADVGGGSPAAGIKAPVGDPNNQDDANDRAAEDQAHAVQLVRGPRMGARVRGVDAGARRRSPDRGIPGLGRLQEPP